MTGNELFNVALDLLGLNHSINAFPSDTDDLQARALSLINLTLAENAELDCRIRRIEHIVTRIDSMDDRIDCCDIVTSMVLPYGLARLLILGEDDRLAADMNTLYSDAKIKALSFGKAKCEPISEVYE